MEGTGNKSEKWITHYSSSHRILLVGEGDFSFSLCLANAFGSATNMVATCLDDEESLQGKYRWGIRNVRELAEMGCTVLFEIDAMELSNYDLLRITSFDRIIYNFPHVGFLYHEDHTFQIELNKRLVKGFLKNAKEMLRERGEIHVSHKTGYPYDRWDLVKIAEKIGLVLEESVIFRKDDYPGYSNKRADGDFPDASFNIRNSRTFKFRHKTNIDIWRYSVVLTNCDVEQVAEQFLELQDKKESRERDRVRGKALIGNSFCLRYYHTMREYYRYPPEEFDY